MSNTELMNLTQFAAAAGISRETASGLVKRLQLGSTLPGRKRKWFTEADLEVIKQPRRRGRPVGQTFPVTDPPTGLTTIADACAFLKLSRRYVCELLAEYQVPITRIAWPEGSKWIRSFVPLADVEMLQYRMGMYHPVHTHQLDPETGKPVCRCLAGLRPALNTHPKLFPRNALASYLMLARGGYLAIEHGKAVRSGDLPGEMPDPFAVVEAMSGKF